jgi:hypothetical protein
MKLSCVLFALNACTAAAQFYDCYGWDNTDQDCLIPVTDAPSCTRWCAKCGSDVLDFVSYNSVWVGTNACECYLNFFCSRVCQGTQPQAPTPQAPTPRAPTPAPPPAPTRAPPAPTPATGTGCDTVFCISCDTLI